MAFAERALPKSASKLSWLGVATLVEAMVFAISFAMAKESAAVVARVRDAVVSAARVSVDPEIQNLLLPSK